MKVADLGEARHISALGQYEKPPSPARNWIPPEIVPKDSPATNYTAKSEVYAVCIVAAEVMNMPYNLSLFLSLSSWLLICFMHLTLCSFFVFNHYFFCIFHIFIC